MNGLGAFALGSGLHDGLNPCIFMTCAVFIAQGLWVRSNFLRIIFVLLYGISFLEFNFGAAQVLIFQKDFIFIAKLLYFVLGLVAFVSGVLLFKDWFLLRYGKADKSPLPKTEAHKKGGWGALLVTVILAVILSALAALWPINNYMMLLGNEELLKGQWQLVMPLLTSYVFISMWPLWSVWIVESIKKLQPSFLKIFYASIFFTASSCMIFIFKK